MYSWRHSVEQPTEQPIEKPIEKPIEQGVSRNALRKRSRRIHLSAVSLSALVTVGALISAERSSVALDPAAIDSKTSPAADFSRYSFGTWLDGAVIPDDRPAFGAFDEVDKPLKENLLGLLQGAQSTPYGEKAAALFKQGMDIAARNSAGLDPIRQYLDAIRKAKSAKDLAEQLTSAASPYSPVSFQVGPSFDDPTKNALLLAAGSLGLERDTYLAKDKSTKEIQQAYITNVAAVLELSGYKKSTAMRDAKAMYAFETRIAKLLLDQREIAGNIALVNNPIKIRDLAKIAPIVDWEKSFSESGLNLDDTVINTEMKYFKNAKALFSSVPVSTLKAYYTAQLLRSSESYLGEDISALLFEFYGKVQSGQKAQRPLDQRVLRSVGEFVPDALGQLFADKYFPPEAKVEITKMTAEIVAAFRKRIDANAWMSADTKKKALEKLDRVKVRVGYPDRWLSYDEAAVGTNYFESAKAFGELAVRRELAKVGKPIDNSNWGPVAWVNAFYDPTNNSINFPAGILSGVFFNLKNDPAANFGAIGSVIGHELTHGFDISGSQFDGDGRLTSRWSDSDRKSFEDLNGRLANQYSAIDVPEAGKVDGKLTVGENVADLGGVQVAYDALLARLATVPDPGKIDGLTQQQRFFVASAQSWKAKTRPEYKKYLLGADVHSPDEVRAVQPLRNMAAFYEAFGIKEGDKMWLAPADRLLIW
jgi:putative endopeptidase